MLSGEQIESFCALGYCVGHVSLNEESIARAAQTVWDLCPKSFDSDSPETWQGQVQDCCKSESMEERRGRVKFRECLRDERWLYDLTAANPEILAAVADLIGDPVTPQYVRGLYPVFPSAPRPAEGHCDQHVFQVGVVLYLSDVLPHGGGFTVWPRSHHLMHKRHRTLGGTERRRTFDRTLKRVEATSPVEITGPVGTVIFWHQRLVHTAGINTRRTVRHATLCDFKNEEFLGAAQTTPTDLWETWSHRVRQKASNFESERVGQSGGFRAALLRAAAFVPER
jgi:ectoine hydroxylase-related dioxygenase (phytanoyl-CoA dioxygenase family)